MDEADNLIQIQQFTLVDKPVVTIGYPTLFHIQCSWGIIINLDISIWPFLKIVIKCDASCVR